MISIHSKLRTETKESWSFVSFCFGSHCFLISLHFQKAQTSQLFAIGQMAGSIHHKQMPPKFVFLLLATVLTLNYSFIFSDEILIGVSHWSHCLRQCPYKWVHHHKLLRSTRVISGPILDSPGHPIPF